MQKNYNNKENSNSIKRKKPPIDMEQALELKSIHRSLRLVLPVRLFETSMYSLDKIINLIMI